MTKISSFNVVTIIDGEMYIDGVPAGLPSMEDVNKKQNVILFIRLTAPSGVLGENTMTYINNINRLVYNNIIYYPTLNTETTKVYCAKTDINKLREITVYLNERRYEVTTILNTALNEHIANDTIHVTQEDKDRWNNKVEATTVLIEDSNYNLILSKD